MPLDALLLKGAIVTIEAMGTHVPIDQGIRDCVSRATFLGLAFKCVEQARKVGAASRAHRA